jgi:hypothetical protein
MLVGVIKMTQSIPARSRERARVVAAAVVTAVMAASCHSPASSNDRISLDNSSNGHTVSVATGDKIDITLQTIGPGRYETPTVSGSIRFLGEGDAGLQNPGGPRQLFQFEAVTVGRGEITIPHTRSEPPFPQPPFVVAVEVR